MHRDFLEQFMKCGSEKEDVRRCEKEDIYLDGRGFLEAANDEVCYSDPRGDI